MAMKKYFPVAAPVLAEQLDTEVDGLDGKTYPAGSYLVKDGKKLSIMGKDDFEAKYKSASVRRGVKVDAPATAQAETTQTATPAAALPAQVKRR